MVHFLHIFAYHLPLRKGKGPCDESGSLEIVVLCLLLVSLYQLPTDDIGSEFGL